LGDREWPPSAVVVLRPRDLRRGDRGRHPPVEVKSRQAEPPRGWPILGRRFELATSVVREDRERGVRRDPAQDGSRSAPAPAVDISEGEVRSRRRRSLGAAEKGADTG